MCCRKKQMIIKQEMKKYYWGDVERIIEDVKGEYLLNGSYLRTSCYMNIIFAHRRQGRWTYLQEQHPIEM